VLGQLLGFTAIVTAASVMMLGGAAPVSWARPESQVVASPVPNATTTEQPADLPPVRQMPVDPELLHLPNSGTGGSMTIVVHVVRG
jgi:hypothetical protein